MLSSMLTWLMLKVSVVEVDGCELVDVVAEFVVVNVVFFVNRCSRPLRDRDVEVDVIIFMIPMGCQW